MVREIQSTVLTYQETRLYLYIQADNLFTLARVQSRHRTQAGRRMFRFRGGKSCCLLYGDLDLRAIRWFHRSGFPSL
jgi:hypothetical protein